ncbi:MAG: L-lactate permease, partial [Anaerolineae bacterium]|nr:L-lactate permease [Anaerolineae bacterium]
EREARAERRARPPLLLGFVPYIALVAFLILGLGLTQLIPALDEVELGFGFPATTTGYGVTREAEEVYSGLNPISHPGTSILLAVLLGYVIFRSGGYVQREQVPEILKQMAGNALPASVAVVGFLAMSQTMDHSGQIFVLARGIAEVLGPALYSGASVLIGTLGAFMTSSNTASNVLFSPLHVQAAETLDINQGIVLGGQMAGGAYGNAVAPANVVLGTGTAQIAGQEGAVLRLTLPWTLALALVGALATIGAYLLV